MDCAAASRESSCERRVSPPRSPTAHDAQQVAGEREDGHEGGELDVVEAVPGAVAVFGGAEDEAGGEEGEPEAEAEREERGVAPAFGRAGEHDGAAGGAPEWGVGEIEALGGALAGVLGPEVHGGGGF